MKQVRSFTLESDAIEKIEQIAEKQFSNNKSMALAHIIERGYKSWKEEKEMLENAQSIIQVRTITVE